MISYAGVQCYQGSSAPWEKVAALHRSSSSPFHAISSSLLPFLYPICSSLQLSLGSHFVISRIAGNKSKANYSLIAPGLLDPRMGRLQDTQKSRKLGRDRKNSIPQGKTVEFWSYSGDLGKTSKLFRGCWHQQQQLKFFLKNCSLKTGICFRRKIQLFFLNC